VLIPTNTTIDTPHCQTLRLSASIMVCYPSTRAIHHWGTDRSKAKKQTDGTPGRISPKFRLFLFRMKLQIQSGNRAYLLSPDFLASSWALPNRPSRSRASL
jgi:hypothetical protein